MMKIKTKRILRRIGQYLLYWTTSSAFTALVLYIVIKALGGI
ncbi:hypothetical protein [Ileibacterium valens]|nr:hypothetical protein [Ileibacterium valens]